MTHFDADIIVVGGGLVGASLALALAQGDSAGTSNKPPLRIALIDAAPAPVTPPVDGYDPRVVALNAASQTFLSGLGIWQRLPRLCAYRRMQVWDGEGTGRVSFDAADEHRDNLGHIVENRVLLATLWQALQECTDLTLVTEAKVEAFASDEGQVILNNGDCWRAPLVIAADGSQSPLRAMAGIQTRQWRYGQTAIVTTITTERPHQHCAYQRFAQQGPLAFLPLPGDGHNCSIVWSLDEQQAQAMMGLTDQDFCSAVAGALEYQLGVVTAVDPRIAIPLNQCHAVDYYRPGLVLVGDAAHAIHPLAGQGANLGLADAAALASEIHRARQRRIPLGDLSILARYQRQRMGHNLAAMAAMEGFKNLFGQSSLAIAVLRGWGMQRVDQWPWLKRQFMQLARGA